MGCFTSVAPHSSRQRNLMPIAATAPSFLVHFRLRALLRVTIAQHLHGNHPSHQIFIPTSHRLHRKGLRKHLTPIAAITTLRSRPFTIVSTLFHHVLPPRKKPRNDQNNKQISFKQIAGIEVRQLICS